MIDKLPYHCPTRYQDWVIFKLFQDIHPKHIQSCLEHPGMPYQSQGPIIFELARKLHIPPWPSGEHARAPPTLFLSLSFFFYLGTPPSSISFSLGRYGRLRDYQQPPWQRTHEGPKVEGRPASAYRVDCASNCSKLQSQETASCPDYTKNRTCHVNGHGIRLLEFSLTNSHE